MPCVHARGRVASFTIQTERSATGAGSQHLSAESPSGSRRQRGRGGGGPRSVVVRVLAATASTYRARTGCFCSCSRTTTALALCDLVHNTYAAETTTIGANEMLGSNGGPIAPNCGSAA